MLGANTAQAHRRRNAAPAYPLQSGAHSNTFVCGVSGARAGPNGCVRVSETLGFSLV